jgi:hypothetical protein
MQTINLDSQNTSFDATIKSYGSLDYLVKILNDNSGSISSLTLKVSYDDKLNVLKPNYAIQLGVKLNPNISYQKTYLQTEFDVITNVCYGLDDLANILNANDTKIGGKDILYTIDKSFIGDNKANRYLTDNKIRFNTGYSTTQQRGGLNFLLQENLDYLLQENSDRIIIE